MAKSSFKSIADRSKSKFKSIADRSKSEFKPRKESTTKLGQGPAGTKKTQATRGGYVEYLRGMTGRNKSVPLTPEQFKKTGNL